MNRRRWLWSLLPATALVAWLLMACAPGAPAVTPTPTKTRVAVQLPANTPIPTQTPQPSATATLALPSPSPPPTGTPPATATEPVPSDTPMPPPTVPPATAPPTPRPPTATAQSPLPPQQDGEWDMEAGFAPGSSPLGEDCPGWAVAVGWQAFVAPGTPASSCLNENKNPANVHSGQRSQELTFDFIQAEAGIYRQAQTLAGHRYQIEAWGKHVRSAAPVVLSLGIDLPGGQEWQSPSVTWHPWDSGEEETWVHTQRVVRASSNTLTIFLKGYHPAAAQGGATLFDDVRIVDLGP